MNQYKKYTSWILTMMLVVSSSAPAYAKQYRVVKYSNGTGFFVSKDGHLVTNAHVVDKCLWAEVSGAGMTTRARIVAKDSKNDMALLLTTMTPAAAASFRPASFTLEEGEDVVIVGHPLGKSLTTKTSKLIAKQGPLGESQWLQFSNSIFQGNSGGPLLDSAGQVVGMIMAKSTLYRYNPQLAKKEVISNSDIAIQTHILENFLKAQKVPLHYSTSRLNLTPNRIENTAKNYIVKVKCIIQS